MEVDERAPLRSRAHLGRDASRGLFEPLAPSLRTGRRGREWSFQAWLRSRVVTPWPLLADPVAALCCCTTARFKFDLLLPYAAVHVRSVDINSLSLTATCPAN
jgi:hypothetical protein